MKNRLDRIWDEFSNLPLQGALSEFAGFLAVLPAKPDKRCVLIDTRKLVIARRIMKLVSVLGEDVRKKITAPRGNFLELDKNRGKAMIRISDQAYLEVNPRPFEKWSYFRGVWGGCGAIYLPRIGYYMSLRLPGGTPCEGKISRILSSARVAVSTRPNKGRTEYMIRGLEDIVTVFASMGLVKTSLSFEETAVIRSARGAANKMTNCDRANIEKSLEAAKTQMKLVNIIEDKMLWGAISKQLAEVARARLEHPSASLGEIGQYLSKPVTKSTVEYRWKKLEAFLLNEENVLNTKRG